MTTQIEGFFFVMHAGEDYAMAEEINCERKVISTCPVCCVSRCRYNYHPVEAHVKFPTKKWPDFLSALGGAPLVSDRVLQDLHEANIADFKVHAVSIYDVPATKTPPFLYWLLEPLKMVDCPILFADDDQGKGKLCPNCGCWDRSKFPRKPYPEPSNFPNPYYDLKFGLQDNFIEAGFNGMYTPCCSVKIIELALKKRWTNFTFKGSEVKNWIRYKNGTWRENFISSIQKWEAKIQGDVIESPQQPVVIKEAKNLSFPSHYFNELFFDGTSFQGEIKLQASFNEQVPLIVYPDVVNCEDYDKPTPDQYAFYDFLLQNDNALTGILKDYLLNVLQKIETTLKKHIFAIVPATLEQYQQLSQWLESPEISFEDTIENNTGLVRFMFDAKGTDVPITVDVLCNMTDKTFHIKTNG